MLWNIVTIESNESKPKTRGRNPNLKLGIQEGDVCKAGVVKICMYSTKEDQDEKKQKKIK